MSLAEEISWAVLAINDGDPLAPIHRDALRALTAGRYVGAGANGALFGFRYPWMISCGELRFLGDHGRRRLGL